MTRILISAPYMQPRMDEFRARFAALGMELVAPTVRERLEEDELLTLIPGVDGVICGDDRFTRRVFEAADRLKVVTKWGTGVDSIDHAAAADHSVRICRTPGAFTIPVADTVFAYLLAFARRLTDTVESMRAGEWTKLPGHTLRERTLGVIGVGDIGRAVIRRAVAFEMPVVVCDIREVDAATRALPGVVVVSHEEVFRRADYLTLHTDLNPTSQHLVNERSLSLMKRDAVLINTSRGPVVHEAALVRALQEGRLRGAALDVFEHEPLPSESPLRKMKNVLLAPHNSNSSAEAWERVHESSIRQLLDGLGVEERA